MPEPTRSFRMPAEWEPHAATWLAWPHRRSDWPGRFSPIPWVYTEIVRAVSRHEPVNLIVPGPKTQARAAAMLAGVGVDLGQVRFFTLPTDRGWVRDSGPIVVVDDASNRLVLDWHFNAWAKYPDWTRDDTLPAFAAAQLGLPARQPVHRGWRVVLEGGSIDVNGRGLMLSTEECLLSKQQERNPPFGRSDYEAVFAEHLGVRKVLWLNRGIAGDDTHGHVDDLARFVTPATIVTVVEENPADENYAPLQENRERLRDFTDVDGGKLEVVELPMPGVRVYDGLRIPASYANFYVANGVVIVPTFNDPADRRALGILADLFPGREVIGISCVDLVWGLGTLHCMAQQEPLGSGHSRSGGPGPA